MKFPFCLPATTVYRQLPLLRSFPNSFQSQRAGRDRQSLCQNQEAMTCLIWNPLHGHLPRQLLSVVQFGFAFLPSLPGWQRQSLNLPQYAYKQAPRQVALRQH